MVNKFAFLAAILFSALLATFVVGARPVGALQVDKSCTTVEAVFARGSGQDLAGPDSAKFFSEFKQRVPEAKISQTTYELGYESYGGHKYKAIAIAPLKGVGAKISSGYSNGYGASVDSGVGELYSYLTQRYAKCKNTQFILGGYSQGAQVIGQTLPKFSVELRKNITFAALFGDPKLYLPEGKGDNPPACQGKQFSPWRRLIANCRVYSGSLNGRAPYVPSDMAAKTGLWCYPHDYICGSSKKLGDWDGHEWYRKDDMAIDIAIGEAVARLATTLPKNQADQLITIEGSGYGTTGLDVAFVLDTTGSMSGQIEASKQFIRQSAAKIKALNGRVSLTVYRDAGDEYTAKILSPLQSSPDDLLAKLDSVEADGGDDWEEAGLHALMTTFNGLKWQDGATKATIMLTDAPFHDPDAVDGTTIAQVGARSLEIDPVNVYPVLSDPYGDLQGQPMEQYAELAERTSGQVIIDTGNTVAALEKALIKIEKRPTALLKNTEYQADPGQEITFDASDSYVLDATITKYEWDYNGDGIFEQTTTAPVANRTYAQKFDGNMQVRLTASNGTIASASAVVKVGTYAVPVAPAAPTKLATTVLSTSGDVSTVRLSWQPGDTLAKQWKVSVNGVPLGLAVGSQTTIEITDVPRDELAVFGVSGVTADGTEGEAKEAELAKNSATPPPTTPPKTSWWQLLIEFVRRLVYSWSAT